MDGAFHSLDIHNKYRLVGIRTIIEMETGCVWVELISKLLNKDGIKIMYEFKINLKKMNL